MTALNGKLLRALALPGSRELLNFNPFMLDAASKYGDINVLANPVLRKELGILPPIGGGSSPLLGVHNASDVIVRTIDGVDTNVLWNEFQTLMQILNGQRAPIVDLLTYTVPNPWELVPQASNANVFEKASEYGVPVAQRAGVTYFQMGVSFDWYDTGLRYTWKYLAEATAEQIRADTEAIGESDSRLVFLEVMKTLFRNTNRITTIDQKGYNVYAFYNNDGTVPPSYKTNTFLGTHTHYLASGAATIQQGNIGTSTPGDLDTITNHLAHHGYTASNGYTLVALVNAQEGDLIRTFRTPTNGGTAKYDFIPAIGTPAFILPANLITNSDQTVARPAGTYRGIKVIGQYGDLLILQDDYFPAGYVTAFATGGPDNIQNPIGIREHVRADLRGLRLVKGRDPDYPLQDAYYQRGFGTGIRQRGAGVVMKITTGAYSTPTQYT
jgi:hypothetical protein